MLANDQMKAGRYLRWHKARRKVAAIQRHLLDDHMVQISTYTKAWRYRGADHTESFKADRTGVYVRRGKGWDCIDGCAVRVFS